MKKLSICALTLSLCAFSLSSFAADLLEVYRLALRNDPAYRGIASRSLSQSEAVPQAWSALLPTIAGSGGRSFYNNVFTRNVNTITTNQTTYGVDVSQTVFNWAAFMSIKQANAVRRQSDAEAKAAKQDLMIRTAKAYFAVLEAQDTLRFTTMERKANERQLDQAKQRYKVGLDAITAVYEAQASYDTVVSQEIAAENEVVNTKEQLREITGTFIDKLAPLKRDFILKKPEPADVKHWVDLSIRFNNTLRAVKHETDAARYGVKVTRASFYPALNFVGTYSDVRGGSLFETQIKRVGLELDVPIFEGGKRFSETRQSKYDLDTTLAKLDQTTKAVISVTHQQYNSVIAGISAVRADKQAVKSTNSALESTEAAFKVGTRTMVDVLDKQQELYDAQRKLSQDQYAFINDSLALKQSAGTLAVVDLEEVNTWLKSSQAYTTMERYKPVASVKQPQPSATSTATNKKENAKSYSQAQASLEHQPLPHARYISKHPLHSQFASVQVPLRHTPKLANKLAEKAVVAEHKIPLRTEHQPAKIVASNQVHYQVVSRHVKLPTVNAKSAVLAAPTIKPTIASTKPISKTVVSTVRSSVPSRRITSAEIKSSAKLVQPKKSDTKVSAITKPANYQVESRRFRRSEMVSQPAKQIVKQQLPKSATKTVVAIDDSTMGRVIIANQPINKDSQVAQVSKRDDDLVELNPVRIQKQQTVSISASGNTITKVVKAKIAKKAEPKRNVQQQLAVKHSASKSFQYYLQVAAFSQKAHAESMLKKLRKTTQAPVSIVRRKHKDGKMIYGVRVGPIANPDKLYAVHDNLQDNGFGDSLVLKG